MFPVLVFDLKNWPDLVSASCAESFAREVRALAVTVYFGSAALLWAVDSPHLAIVMVHLNVLESVLALKIKALNDSVAKAVQQIQNVQLQFALLVRPSLLLTLPLLQITGHAQSVHLQSALLVSHSPRSLSLY